MSHSLSYPPDAVQGVSSRVHSLDHNHDHSRVSGHHNGFTSLFGHTNGQREGINHFGHGKKYSQAKRRSIIGLDAGIVFFFDTTTFIIS